MSELFTEALISEAPIIVRRRVLWGECDPAAVVYTPRFAEYAASARDWFLRVKLGVLDRPHPKRVALTYPMRAMSFDFSSFLAADDIFDMTVFVDSLSSRTFTLIVTGDPIGKSCAFTSKLTSVCFDPEVGGAVPLPDSVRGGLEKYRDKFTPRRA